VSVVFGFCGCFFSFDFCACSNGDIGYQISERSRRIPHRNSQGS
jgi:hypothetical protein